MRALGLAPPKEPSSSIVTVNGGRRIFSRVAWISRAVESSISPMKRQVRWEFFASHHHAPEIPPRNMERSIARSEGISRPVNKRGMDPSCRCQGVANRRGRLAKTNVKGAYSEDSTRREILPRKAARFIRSVRLWRRIGPQTRGRGEECL